MIWVTTKLLNAQFPMPQATFIESAISLRGVAKNLPQAKPFPASLKDQHRTYFKIASSASSVSLAPRAFQCRLRGRGCIITDLVKEGIEKGQQKEKKEEEDQKPRGGRRLKRKKQKQDGNRGRRWRLKRRTEKNGGVSVEALCPTRHEENTCGGGVRLYKVVSNTDYPFSCLL